MKWPSSVETLITSRIDRLDVEEQLILKEAAVLSPTGFFTQHQLEPMLKVGSMQSPSSSSIRGILRSLQESDFLSIDYKHSKPTDPAYQFKHVSVQQARWRARGG